MERPLLAIFLVLGIIGCIFSLLLVESMLEENEVKQFYLPSSIVERLQHKGSRNLDGKSLRSPHSPRPSNSTPPSNSPSPSPSPSNSKNETDESSHSHHNHTSVPSLPPLNYQGPGHSNNKAPVRKMNHMGKKIGFLFLVIAGVLQVTLIGFLLYKRFKISKI